MPICFLCKETISSVNGLFMHFDIKHTGSSLMIYECGENNCYRKWSSRNSFRKHLLGANHSFPAWSTINHNTCKHYIRCNNIKIVNECMSQNDTNNSNILSEESTTNNYLSAITLSEFESIIKNHAFIAKLYNRPSIPRNHIQFIVEDITGLLANGHISILKETVISYLNIFGADIDILQKITSIFYIIA